VKVKEDKGNEGSKGGRSVVKGVDKERPEGVRRVVVKVGSEL
jgi:hypothetical protein